MIDLELMYFATHFLSDSFGLLRNLSNLIRVFIISNITALTLWLRVKGALNLLSDL